mmetsp:Transcript_9557/g.26839  ORF Transcript_9557/g.26839 Transcript_9557/m.26839 type:complete len:492 (-) Transcript_9557:159-1634(-)
MALAGGEMQRPPVVAGPGRRVTPPVQDQPHLVHLAEVGVHVDGAELRAVRKGGARAQPDDVAGDLGQPVHAVLVVGRAQHHLPDSTTQVEGRWVAFGVPQHCVQHWSGQQRADARVEVVEQAPVRPVLRGAQDGPECVERPAAPLVILYPKEDGEPVPLLARLRLVGAQVLQRERHLLRDPGQLDGAGLATLQSHRPDAPERPLVGGQAEVLLPRLLDAADLEEAPDPVERPDGAVQDHDDAHRGLREGDVEGTPLRRASELVGGVRLVDREQADPEGDVLGARLRDLEGAERLPLGHLRLYEDAQRLHGLRELVAPPVAHEVVHDDPLRVNELGVGAVVAGGAWGLRRSQALFRHPRAPPGALARHRLHDQLVDRVQVGDLAGPPALPGHPPGLPVAPRDVRVLEALELAEGQATPRVRHQLWPAGTQVGAVQVRHDLPEVPEVELKLAPLPEPLEAQAGGAERVAQLALVGVQPEGVQGEPQVVVVEAP